MTGPTNRGRRIVYLPPGHPMRYRAGWCYLARLILFERLGRRPERHEHAHHANGDRLDDRPGNVRRKAASEHARLHARRRLRDRRGRFA